ncbi:MAG: pantetheine-phosphate adenylyltransferase [Candidatus Omnitrophica bacterium]|nr:pantetheine-phosphate adenylyltransferase [Candidatus Omnitrophota bacterium]MDD5574405.1 pantetheine-phosphate adenylyltransferase [Candidatus Omnitrophota bacterium]
MCQKAIYPGTFDPVTYGHIDVIKRAVRLFGDIVVAVAEHTSKDPLFSVKERVALLKKALEGISGVDVVSFSGLFVEFARSQKAAIVIRGLRMLSDFEYEFQMALTNRKLDDTIETIFLMPSESYSYVSSKLLKEAGGLGADLSAFVPPCVEEALKKKLNKQERRKS